MFISESPQIQAQFEKCRNRWPAIAAAADHPLTETLRAKMTFKKQLAREALDFAFVALILIFFGFYFSDRLSFLQKQFVFAFYMIGIFVISYFHKRTERGLSDFLERKNPGLLTDLKMTPLSFREIVAIDCVSRILQPRIRWLGVARLLFVSAFIIYILNSRFFKMAKLDFPPYYRALVSILIPLIILTCVRWQLEVRARKIMMRSWIAVASQKELFRFNWKTFAVIFAIAVGLAVSMPLFNYFFKPSATAVILIYFICIALFFVFALPLLNSSSGTEKAFLRLTERGEELYRNLEDNKNANSIFESKNPG